MKPHPESLDGKPPPKRYRWWRFIEHSLPIIVIYLMVATLVSFLIAPNVIVTVPTGHVGILWKRFRGGTQLDPRLLKDEGMRVLLPWDKLFLYDLRLQTHDDTYNAISKDGVNLKATIDIRFRLKHDAVPQLHQTIGPDYVKRMLSPEIGNRAREIFAEYTAEEVYSTKRQEIQKKIRTHTEAMLGQSMIQRTEQESEYGEHYRMSLSEFLIIYDTLVLGLELPATVNAAINRKIEQYYLVAGVRLPGRAREEGIRAQADRGLRHPRLPADGDAGNFRLLRALARHRGNAAARAVAQHQDRDHRQRQGRTAGHSRQCRYADAAEPGRARGPARRGDAPRQQRSGPANARQRPARRSWKRRRRAICRARRNGRRRPGCRAGRRPGQLPPVARKTACPAQRQVNRRPVRPPKRAHLGPGRRFRTSFHGPSVRERRRWTVIRRRQRQERARGQGQDQVRPRRHILQRAHRHLRRRGLRRPGADRGSPRPPEQLR